MPPKSILIKKYENRRLYDVTNSRYVNLDEVARLLKDGNDVRVVDAASGNDITRVILTQIIVEDARDPDSTFPIDLLREMILSSGRASQETALRYMKSMLNIYQDTYRAIAPSANPFEFFRPAGHAGAPPNQTTQPSPANSASEPSATNEESVDELKRRVAGLEKLVSSMSPQKSKPRTSARKLKKASRTSR
ncbi:MAG: polyhydroxyalkanoate synthesis regulator DNA-binding domain-containing protein [Acidobacteriaceae bacterium]